MTLLIALLLAAPTAPPYPFARIDDVPLDFTPAAFACYPRADHEVVIAVMRLLADRGLDTWRDEDDLRPGDDWALAIKRAIRRADAVLAFLAADGPTAQQALEILAAGSSGVPVIPVLLPDYEGDELPEPLRATQAVDLRTTPIGRAADLLAEGVRAAAEGRGS
jgi:hypothetical protein